MPTLCWRALHRLLDSCLPALPVLPDFPSRPVYDAILKFWKRPVFSKAGGQIALIDILPLGDCHNPPPWHILPALSPDLAEPLDRYPIILPNDITLPDFRFSPIFDTTLTLLRYCGERITRYHRIWLIRIVPVQILFERH